jgi:hypothetical protein
MRFNTILIQHRKLADRFRCAKIVLVLLAGVVTICLLWSSLAVGTVAAAQTQSSTASPQKHSAQYVAVTAWKIRRPAS